MAVLSAYVFPWGLFTVPAALMRKSRHLVGVRGWSVLKHECASGTGLLSLSTGQVHVIMYHGPPMLGHTSVQTTFTRQCDYAFISISDQLVQITSSSVGVVPTPYSPAGIVPGTRQWRCLWD